MDRNPRVVRRLLKAKLDVLGAVLSIREPCGTWLRGGPAGEVPAGGSGREMRTGLDPSCVTTGTFRLARDREVRKGSVSLAATGRDLCF